MKTKIEVERISENEYSISKLKQISPKLLILLTSIWFLLEVIIT